MKNPIFLILIVTRNRDNNSGARTKELFNEGEASDSKGSNVPRILYGKTKYTYDLNNETPSDADGSQGNIPAE
jgi:hypothetical protein